MKEKPNSEALAGAIFAKASATAEVLLDVSSHFLFVVTVLRIHDRTVGCLLGRSQIRGAVWAYAVPTPV